MAKPKPKSDPNLGPLLRKKRKALGLTLQALCDKAGLSVGYLSQVERDFATPSLGTLAQIAQALDVGLDYFITSPKPADALTRADERPQFSLNGSSIVYESIGSDFPGAELSSYILHVPPGYQSEVVKHEGEELIYILEGQILQVLGEESFLLNTGDSLHYSGNTRHAWSNPGAETARILWTGTLSVLQGKGALKIPEISVVNNQYELSK